MSPPRKPHVYSPSRRVFLRQAGIAGTSLAAAPWLVACEDTAHINRPAGAASGAGREPDAGSPGDPPGQGTNDTPAETPTGDAVDAPSDGAGDSPGGSGGQAGGQDGNPNGGQTGDPAGDHTGGGNPAGPGQDNSDSGADDTDTPPADDEAPADDGSQPPADDDQAPAQPATAVVFLHGVASGDPLSDAVMLWTRVTPQEAEGENPGPISGRYIVARDAALADVVFDEPFTTDAARDFTVKIDRDGLAPGTTYYYRFSANDSQSPIGRTRTAPVGRIERMRVAYTSCSQLPNGFFNVYAAIAARDDLDLVLHLGDYIYEYGDEQYGEAAVAGRSPEPPVEIVTRDDYRRRHAQYKTDLDLQALHAAHPMVVVWDDHESTNNSWENGAANHQPETEGDWQVRKANSIAAYYEWLPIRAVEPERPERIYRRFAWGDLVDLLMLDTRLLARDEQAASPADSQTIGDERRTLLGFEQEGWLNRELSRSAAQWKLIGQQVMFMPLRLVGLPQVPGADLLAQISDRLSLVSYGGVPVNVDQWDGYPAARRRVIDQIRIQGIDNVAVLAGDIHSSWAMDVTEDPNDPTAYNPITGAGSKAVEFVSPSVTSSGLPELQPARNAIMASNPHMKYIDTEAHGYVILDIDRERLQGEFWYVQTIAERSAVERFATSFVTASGANRLSERRTASTGEAATATTPTSAGDGVGLPGDQAPAPPGGGDMADGPVDTPVDTPVRPETGEVAEPLDEAGDRLGDTPATVS